MAARLSSGQPGPALLENTLSTVASLAVIVAVLAPVSGPRLAGRSAWSSPWTAPGRSGCDRAIAPASRWLQSGTLTPPVSSVQMPVPLSPYLEKGGNSPARTGQRRLIHFGIVQFVLAFLYGQLLCLNRIHKSYG